MFESRGCGKFEQPLTQRSALLQIEGTGITLKTS